MHSCDSCVSKEVCSIKAAFIEAVGAASDALWSLDMDGFDEFRAEVFQCIAKHCHYYRRPVEAVSPNPEKAAEE